LTCVGLKQYSFSSRYSEDQVQDGRYIIDSSRDEILLKLTTSPNKKKEQPIKPVVVEESETESSKKYHK
jgi:hypothetical protein